MRVFYTVTCGGERSRREKVEERAKVLSTLLEKLGQDPGTPVDRDNKGRLHFPDNSPLDLSLSHAAPFTTYAVGNVRVGIDMEDPLRIRHPKRLAERFFTEAERAYVLAAEDPRAATCLIWTKKEALAKYLGEGFAATYHICTFSPPEGVEFYSMTVTLNDRVYNISLCTHQGAEICEC